MRTTVTLEEDVQALIEGVMREKGVSFREALNGAVRAGLARKDSARFQQRTFSMGFRPEVNYDKALALAGALEDQELTHKLALGK